MCVKIRRSVGKRVGERLISVLWTVMMTVADRQSAST